MKIHLTEILQIGNSMKAIEGAGLRLSPADQVRWAVARKRLNEFIDPYIENVRAEFAKGEEKTEKAWIAAETRVRAQVNGDEFEVSLPEPIKLEAVKELSCQKPEQFDALVILVGPIFADIPKSSEGSP
jgi:hypothetical protein